jgi:hypothetical protein
VPPLLRQDLPLLSTYAHISSTSTDNKRGPQTYKRPRNRARPTGLDLILLARGWSIRIIPTTAPYAEEQVVVVAILVPKRRLLRLRTRRHERNLRGTGHRLRNLRRRRSHLDLKQVAPETPKIHDHLTIRDLQVAIDGVELAARDTLDAGAAQVGPRSDVHGTGSCDADGAVLRTKGGDAVVEVIC